jgi:hypothetical protein
MAGVEKRVGEAAVEAAKAAQQALSDSKYQAELAKWVSETLKSLAKVGTTR